MWLPSSTGPGCLASDDGEEAVEGVFVVEAGAEVDPGPAAEEARKIPVGRLLPTGQENRDHPVRAMADLLVQRRPHLLVLPRAERLAEKDGAVAALVEGLLQRLLPGIAGDQVPFVEKRLEPRLLELAGEVLHGRLVGAGVAEEDVVAGHQRSTRLESILGG